MRLNKLDEMTIPAGYNLTAQELRELREYIVNHPEGVNEGLLEGLIYAFRYGYMKAENHRKNERRKERTADNGKSKAKLHEPAI